MVNEAVRNDFLRATINQWCALGPRNPAGSPAIRWSDPGLPHQMSNHRTARGPQDPIFSTIAPQKPAHGAPVRGMSNHDLADR